VRRTYTSAVIDAPPPSSVPLPTTVKAAIAAVGAMILFSLAEAATLFGNTTKLTKLLVDSNANAKKPKLNYTATQIAHDLHQFRIGTVVQTIAVAIAMVILALLLRKVRSASLGRWALIVIMVITGGPFLAIPATGWPAVPGTLRVLQGASSIAVIVLLLLPASSRYFRECKALAHPGATPRPSMLGGMFGPRSAATRGSTGSVSTTKTASTTANPSANKSKAKVRADEASVARGAELARTRAKAAKSRKSEE
jgi:hypothetical protein